MVAKHLKQFLIGYGYLYFCLSDGLYIMRLPVMLFKNYIIKDYF